MSIGNPEPRENFKVDTRGEGGRRGEKVKSGVNQWFTGNFKVR